MTKLPTLLIILCLFLAGCGAAATPDPAAIAQAVQATIAAQPAPVPVQVEVTRIVEVPVEVTRVVQVIVEATPTPQPDQEPPAGLVRYPDIMVSQDQSGLILAVDGVSIVPFADMPVDFQSGVSAFSYWDNIATVIALSVVLTNTTDATLNIYPDQGAIVVGSQQADADIWASEKVGGEIYAGVTKAGLVLFGLPQPVDPASLPAIRYIVNAATTLDFDSAGQDYDLTIPLIP